MSEQMHKDQDLDTRVDEGQPQACPSAGSTAASNEVAPAACLDCGLPYSAFPLDVGLPRAQWLAIHPEGEGGLLCAACIVARAAKLPGVTVAHMVLEVASKGRCVNCDHLSRLSHLQDEVFGCSTLNIRLHATVIKDFGCTLWEPIQTGDYHDMLRAAHFHAAKVERELAEVTLERDLAIAHDRQPYPTADAYERVCAALANEKQKVSELQQRLESIGSHTGSYPLGYKDDGF